MTAHRVTLGRVAGVYGVRGWIRVHSQTRPADNIFRYKRWWITGGARTAYEATVIECRLQGSGLVAQISGADGQPISDRNLAAALVGADIEVARSDMPPLPQGQYYWIDLIGLQVENLSGTPLGVVKDMTSNGAQDVLVIEDGAIQRLIPYVSGPVIKQVDMAARRIVCDWLPEYDEN
jgi:16S rRNA processing protein RimM